MIGRLTMTAAAVFAVIAIEELLEKSQFLYVLVVSGEMSFGRLLYLWLNLLPLIAYHAIPEVISLSIAFRYYLWTEQKEILILKNAGLSCFSLARPGLIAAGCFAVLCGLNSLWLVSPTWVNVENIRAAAITNFDPDILQPGSQQRLGPDLSLEFDQRLADGSLSGIVVLDVHEAPKFRMIWAKLGQFIRLGDQLLLELNQGAVYVRDRAGDRADGYTVRFDHMTLPVRAGDATALPPRSPGILELPFAQLINPPPEIRNDRLQFARGLVEAHQRITAPLLCIGNSILVLGLLIPGYRGRTQQLFRLFITVVSAIATNTLPAPLNSVFAVHLEFLPCFYLLPIVPATIGTLLLIRGDTPSSKRPKQSGPYRQPDHSLTEKPA